MIRLVYLQMTKVVLGDYLGFPINFIMLTISVRRFSFEFAAIGQG